VVNAGVIGLCIGAGSWLQGAGVGHLYGGALDLLGAALFLPQVLLVLLVFDAPFYWVHRAAHASRLLYRWLHRDHHEDRYPDAWSAAQQHPLGLFLTTALPMAGPPGRIPSGAASGPGSTP
jgi:sterol desaturase/sphingolipid hydroxylase (fatty acid hydroxylase superfamily)